MLFVLDEGKRRWNLKVGRDLGPVSIEVRWGHGRTRAGNRAKIQVYRRVVLKVVDERMKGRSLVGEVFPLEVHGPGLSRMDDDGFRSWDLRKKVRWRPQR